MYFENGELVVKVYTNQNQTGEMYYYFVESVYPVI